MEGKIGQQRRLIGGKRIHLKFGVGAEHYGYPELSERWTSGAQANSAWNIAGYKNDKTEPEIILRIDAILPSSDFSQMQILIFLTQSNKR